ncbi:MAG: GIY-YIG nuclease family protein [Nanoarchaeota archaeon]|nr:GIY-YIG nuclease family protein [Nanoarchaeota archaeon]
MIYFIKSESGHVKIGYTDNNIESRLAALQTGNPFKLSILKLIDFPQSQEILIHQKFYSARCQGEWFLLTEDILKFIESPYLIKPQKELNQKKQINKQIDEQIDELKEKLKRISELERQDIPYEDMLIKLSEITHKK